MMNDRICTALWISLMAGVFLLSACDRQPPTPPANTANPAPAQSKADTSARTETPKADPSIEQRSSQVEFVFLDRVEADLAAAQTEIEKQDWPAALQHVDAARHTLHAYRSLHLPKSAASRVEQCREKLSDVIRQLGNAADETPDVFVTHWRNGEVYYDSLRELYNGRSASPLEAALKQAESQDRDALRVQRLRGVCIYLHAPQNPLLEHHMRLATRQLSDLPGRSCYVWSNRTGPRLSGKPWLNVRLEIRERTKPYEIGSGDFTYQTSLVSGYTLSIKVDSAVDVSTSWDDHKRLELEVDLPKEMRFLSSDSWFPRYVESRARHLAAESAGQRLQGALGPLLIHPDAHDQLDETATQPTVARLRALAAHQPDVFAETVKPILKSAGKSNPDGVQAVVVVLAEGDGDLVVPAELVAAIAGLDAKTRESIAADITKVRNLFHPGVMLAMLSQQEGAQLGRLVSSIHFADEDTRRRALPYADGKLPCLPKPRLSIATYLLNFTSREGDARQKFIKAQAHWLSDPDPIFAGELAQKFIGVDPDLAGEFLLNSLKQDARSAVMFTRASRFGKCPQEAQIALKAIPLIPLAPDPDVQKRLATMLSVRAGLSSDHWKALLQIASHKDLTAASKKRIVEYLRKKASIVDEQTRTGLNRL